MITQPDKQDSKLDFRTWIRYTTEFNVLMHYEMNTMIV